MKYLQIIDEDPFPEGLLVQFEGLSVLDDGEENGLPIEPPNPCACPGNGFVLQVSNDVGPYIRLLTLPVL